MATIDSSIVIISMPAIFRGIHLNPTAPGNISYLLWMIIGYLLVTAVLVVTLGRLGDMFGRVRIYNLGFVVFTLASIALSLDPLEGSSGALWLILWRIVQAFGGAMLMANAAAILTDAFPARQRGMALGINQISGISGQFIGLVLGGVLAAWNWRAVFWVNVPIGVFGTYWSYRKLREIASVKRARVDWWGNVTFAGGAGLLLVLDHLRHPAVRRPPDGLDEPDGYRRPGGRRGAAGDLLPDRDPDRRADVPARAVPDPRLCRGQCCQPDGLDRARRAPVHADHLAARDLAPATWLRLRADAAASGDLSAAADCRLPDRRTRLGLPVRPVRDEAVRHQRAGIGSGLFASPNTSAIMSSVPARYRGAASGMRSTFQNSGMSLSIGIFFSLMIAGLAATLPKALTTGLRSHGVPAPVAAHIAGLPPVSTLFASFLGYNPIGSLLKPSGVLARLPRADARALTSKEYFPHLIAAPFHHGLVIVFGVAIAMSVAAAVISLLRGGQFYYDAPEGLSAAAVPAAVPAATVQSDHRVGSAAAPVPLVADGPQPDSAL
jgi:MFS family permease